MILKTRYYFEINLIRSFDCNLKLFFLNCFYKIQIMKCFFNDKQVKRLKKENIKKEVCTFKVLNRQNMIF